MLRTFRGGMLAGNGAESNALESEIAERLGTKSVLAVSSGTHALEMACELASVRGG